jgi:hypothetical protein
VNSAATATFAGVLATFVLLHVAAWKAAEKLGLKANVAAAAVSILLCLPGAWFALYYLHWLPEPPLLYELRALRFGEFFLALFGAAAGVLRSCLPKLLKPFPTAAGVFLLTIPFLKPVFNAHDLSTLQDRWEGDTCLQSSPVTCGPACAASLLRHFGDRQVTELDLAREAWTSNSGTEAWHLARALRHRGCSVRFLAPEGLPDPVHLPGILGAGSKRAGHFIVLLSITADEIDFMDPLRGRVKMTRKDFLRWTEFEPFFVSVRHEGFHRQAP